MLRKTAIYIFFFSLLTVAPCLSAGTLEMQISGDDLRLHAQAVPLQTILRGFAEKGIRVQIDPELNPLISVSFEKRDMQKGLRSLLQELDHVLIWESFPGTSEIRLTGIQIFESGKKSRMRPLPFTGNFDVIKNPKDGSLMIRDEILLRPAPGLSPKNFDQFLKSIGGEVLAYDTRTGIYRVRLPENSNIPALAKEIAGNRNIAGAEPNYAYPVQLPYRNISPDVPEAGYVNPVPPQGNVRIAVLDSGLQPGAGMEEYVAAALDAVHPENSLGDSLGHGTQMALIASGAVRPYGVSDTSALPIIPIRSFDDKGMTTSYSMIRSIDFALENGARVLSMSWGSDTQSGFLEQSLKEADAKGLILVAAAGNEPTGKEVWPAAYPSVIGVGALGPDGEKWEKSNYGSSVTVMAPGFASLPVGYKGEAGAYAGTSIAAAYVANRIADYLSKHPEAGKEDVYKFLQTGSPGH